MSMAIPLVVLGGGSLVAGFTWVGLPMDWLGVPADGMAFLKLHLAPVVGPAQEVLNKVAGGGHGEHGGLAWAVAALGTLVATLGVVYGWLRWRKGPAVVPEHGASLAPTGFGGGWTFGFDVVAGWLVNAIKVVAYGLYWVVELAILGIAGWLAATGSRALGDGYALILQRSRLRTALALAMLGLVAAVAFLIFVVA